MKELSKIPDDRSELRKKLMGLGEASYQKSYYPELKQKLDDLERFRAILDQANDAMFLIQAPSGRIVDTNASASRQLGYDRASLLRMSAYNVIRDAHRYFMRLFREDRGSATFTTILARSDGAEIPYEVNASIVHENDLPYVVAVARDITKRLQMEEQLKLFQASVERSTDAIVWHSFDGRMIYANEAACDELGYTKDELSSMAIPDIDPDFTQAKVAKMMDKIRRKGIHIFETRHRTKDGRIFPVEVRAVYLRSGDREFVVTTHRDISDRKELEKARDQAELYLDLMGHDINNFNLIALGYLEMADDVIRSGGRIGDDRAELIERPMASLNSSSRLIDNLRKLQKLKTKELRLCRVDLGKALERMKERYSNYAGRNVTIRYVPTTGCTVVANELIDEIFINLIENSIKHSPPDRPLAIDIAQSTIYEGGNTYHRISVEDNGPGIPDRVKSRLFTRFYRGQAKARGIGLGLYLVKNLVEDFNGRIWVEDRVPGDHTKGARFVILLPAVEDVCEIPRP